MQSKVCELAGIIKVERRRACGPGAQGRHQFAGSRYRKMYRERGAVGPLLEKDEPERILAVDMHRMRDAAGLLPRAADVLEAEAAHLVEGFCRAVTLPVTTIMRSPRGEP